ncbi:MAG: hypothetical protein H9W81_13990 [Enterococcus sp.]|nr:hypothetical protein [Enterococcus sp.]
MIHKIMGYGITGLGYDPKTFLIDDPRIDTDVLTAIQGGEEKFSDTAFGNYLLEKAGDLQNKDTLKKASANDMMDYFMYRIIEEDVEAGFKAANGVIHDAKVGEPSTLIVVPYSNHRDWIRRGDPIDHAEYSASHPVYGAGAYRPVVQPLTEPLYPYDLYMNSFTGENLTRDQHVSVGMYRKIKNALRQELTDAEQNIIRMAANQQVVKAGFLDEDDFLVHCVPAIPEEVENYLRMTGLFTDDLVLRQLRPMIMTYWS